MTLQPLPPPVEHEPIVVPIPGQIQVTLGRLGNYQCMECGGKGYIVSGASWSDPNGYQLPCPGCEHLYQRNEAWHMQPREWDQRGWQPK